MRRVGFFFHPSFLQHETGPGHPERPERLEAIRERLRSSGLWDALVLHEKKCTVFVVDLDSPAIEATGTQSGAERVGTVREVSVDLGVAVGGLIQIRGPVHPDDLVVVVGNERLRNGERVVIIRLVERDPSVLESGLRSASVH